MMYNIPRSMPMYVAKIQEKKSGRVLLNYVRSHRVNGKVKHEVVEKIGYLDELEGIYDDPIAHFKELAKEKTKNAKITIEVDLNRKLSFTGKDKHEQQGNKVYDRIVQYGMLPLCKIFHELEIDYFLNNRRRYTDCEYNLNQMFQMLVYGRILFPDSKLGTWQNRNRLLGDMDFSEDDVYRSLPFFTKHKDALISHLDRRITELYGRQTGLMYYDVTNYYWEIDKDDEGDGLRKTGVSKEHRPNPIVQMGLLMDSQSIPVTYRLFPGNTNDGMTLRPVMEQVSGDFRPENLIYVADKGMMNGDNRAQIILDHNGYVISGSIRGKGVDEKTREWVLKEDGYTYFDDGEFKYKERLEPVEIWVTEEKTGKKKRVRVNERQVAFWSRKYKERAAHERKVAIEKAVKTGTVFNSHAANKYFRKAVVDERTGELIEDMATARELDQELVEMDARLDGYYLIHTNVIGTEEGEKPFKGKTRFRDDNLLELNKEVGPTDIIDIYRGLWRIEECFRITKSQLKARPVFVRRDDSIEAHFLTCFVALIILRLLEKKTGGKIPIPQMVESLRKASLALEDKSSETYLNLYCDAVIEEIGNALNLELTRERYSKGGLKDTLAQSRKSK